MEVLSSGLEEMKESKSAARVVCPARVVCSTCVVCPGARSRAYTCYKPPSAFTLLGGTSVLLLAPCVIPPPSAHLWASFMDIIYARGHQACYAHPVLWCPLGNLRCPLSCPLQPHHVSCRTLQKAAACCSAGRGSGATSRTSEQPRGATVGQVY